MTFLASRSDQESVPQASTADLEFWRDYLAGMPPALELPTKGPRRSVVSRERNREFHRLGRAALDNVRQLSAREIASSFVASTAVFKILLLRYTGQDDVVIGIPINICDRTERSPLVGANLDVRPLRTDLSGNPSFHTLVQRVQSGVSNVIAHRTVSFENLIAAMRTEHELSRSSLFQLVLIWKERDLQSQFIELDGLTVEPVVAHSESSKTDLTICLTDAGDDLWLEAEYSTDLFTSEMIERLVGHFRVLLAALATNAEQHIGDFSLLTAAEERQLLVEWNQTDRDYPLDVAVHEMFESQVLRTPDEVAIVCGSATLTYRELNQRANCVARYLQSLGVGPEVRVGVCLDRGPDLVVGLLGILKAGGAYVPLDPAYPLDRIAFMLGDSKATVVLTLSQHLKALPALGAQIVCLDSDWLTIAERSACNLPRGSGPANLAYVIYTSGSTGLPKGVAIEHHSVVNFICWAQEFFTSEELSGVLAATSVCFDLSVFELFVPLSSGGRVVLVENALDMPSLQANADVRLINTVPSVMVELLRLKAVPISIVTVNLAGEPLSPELADAIYEQTQTRRVYDLYGPSESTTYSTATLRLPNARATIGRPIANTQVYVLDCQMQPVPVGVPGELYIGGQGVARGYLNRPELTAEKFISDRFGAAPGNRLYRTGDRVRWQADGSLEFLGRFDHQVKLRGFRIELGEIEAALSEHPRVAQVAILLREDRPRDKRLVAYVVPRLLEAPPMQTDLRGFLEKKLPIYMIPAAFVVLDRLPLTPNRKIDRTALPIPQDRRRLAEPSVSSEDSIERRIAGLFARVLGLKQVGLHENFFAIGGHSLLAARLIAEIRVNLCVELALHCLFVAPTPSGVAKIVQEQQFGTKVVEQEQPTSPPSDLAQATVATSPANAQGSENTNFSRAAVLPADFLEVVRSGGDGLPIVCVGHAQPIPLLLERFPSLGPIIRLKLDGSHTWPPQHLTVEEQVDAYSRELEDHLRERTAVLVGYSYGGLLAHCLAYHLLKKGFRDIDVMLIEPSIPIHYKPFRIRLRRKLGTLYRLLKKRKRTAHGSGGGEENGPASSKIPDIITRWNLMEPHYHKNIDAARLHPLSVRMALVASRHSHASDSRSWQRHATTDVESCILPEMEKHDSCFHEPGLTYWLDFFQDWYGRRQQSGPTQTATCIKGSSAR